MLRSLMAGSARSSKFAGAIEADAARAIAIFDDTKSVLTTNRLAKAAAKELGGVHHTPNSKSRSVSLSDAGDELFSHKKSFSLLINRLSNGIKEGRWTAVIADDVSGRIPGQVVWNQMRHWARDQEFKPPKFYFMASGLRGVESEATLYNSSYGAENLANLIRRVGTNKAQLESGRVLVVTEHMHSGGSVAKIGSALQQHKIEFDVATLSNGKHVTHAHDVLRAPVEMFEGVYGGMYAGGAGSRYPLRVAAGVEKFGAEATSRVNGFDQSVINQFRRETSRFSTELYEEIFRKQIPKSTGGL